MSLAKIIKKYTPAALSDVLAVFGIPSATAVQVYQDILQQRSDEATEILMNEVKDGNFDGVDRNEVVSIMARYQRDAMEGMAKNNLRILARLVKGMAEKNQLKASSYLKYANIFASLTNEELIVLAIMHGMDRNEKKSFESYKKFESAGIVNPDVIQQALLRTGLVEMTIETRVETTEIAGIGRIGYKNDEYLNLQSEQQYNLTTLADEVFQYLDNFDFKEKAS